jgi:type II secretory pathway pseudopilin PulG
MRNTKLIRNRRSERGAVLLGILLMLTVMIIGFAAYAPNIATRIKRDQEEELIRRGRQYTRAIQLYFRKFGRYPASIEQLENTNNIRFLRRKYRDPISGKDEWRIIRFGQQKVRPMSRGGLGKAGTGGAGNPASGGFGGLGGAQPQGSTQQQSQQQQGQQQQGLGVSAEQISRPLSGSPTFGGGAIIGVSSTSEKQSLKELDGRNKYNEWEFVYDPTQDANARAPQQPPGQQPGPQGQSPNVPGVPQPQERPKDRR